ncbi:MAG: DUF5368 family protein [Halomonas sp.]|nr:DUF5368 family protein [Halomonas sp.]MBR2515348.1 DUF5368 family protein [Halomonas sp.]
MTIAGAITILTYALAPFMWLLIIVVIVVTGLHLLAYLRGYQITRYRHRRTTLLALIIGLTAIIWVPWLTHSSLGYVATLFDWVALLGAAAATFLVALLILQPLSYLISFHNDQ